MKQLLDYLSLPPIRKAFIAFIIAGTSFPLIGIFIVIMNLIPLRFALMHGALLGGVIGLLLGSDHIIFPLMVNLVIIMLLGPFSNRFKIGLSNISAFLMITIIAIAFIIIDLAKIPAMEAFNIFWGNIYALSSWDLLSIISLSLVIIAFIVINFKSIVAILFDREIAFTTGINNQLLYYTVLILTGLTVAFSIKILGALLADCLILLPAMTALNYARGIKNMFTFAAVCGFISACLGFIISIWLKIQPSPAVTVIAVILFFILFLFKKIKRTEGEIIQ